MANARKTIEQALREHTPNLMAMPGVLGTGEGRRNGKPCILVLVVARTPEIDRQIPKEIEGYPVRIEATGEIRARGKSALK